MIDLVHESAVNYIVYYSTNACKRYMNSRLENKTGLSKIIVFWVRCRAVWYPENVSKMFPPYVYTNLAGHKETHM